MDDRLDTILAMILFNLSCNIKIISNGNYMPDSALNSLIKRQKEIQAGLILQFQQWRILILIKLWMSLDKTIRNLDKLHELSEMNPSSTLLIQLGCLSRNKFTSTKTVYWLCQNSLSKIQSFKSPHEWMDSRWLQVSQPDKSAILSSPCLRWSDCQLCGDIALCCMDADATYNLGNAINTNTWIYTKEKYKIF